MNSDHVCHPLVCGSKISGAQTQHVDYIYMSHFTYMCKMQYPLNLVLQNCEYLWFYLTFWVAILDCDLKLHKLLIHTLVMLQK